MLVMEDYAKGLLGIESKPANRVLHNANGQDYFVIVGEIGSGQPALLRKMDSEEYPFISVLCLGWDSWSSGSYFQTLTEAIESLKGRSR